MNLIVCDVIKSTATVDKSTLVEASKAYWTGKGYTLVSDESGPDYLTIHESKMRSDKYDPGNPKAYHGDVILVYQADI